MAIRNKCIRFFQIFLLVILLLAHIPQQSVYAYDIPRSNSQFVEYQLSTLSPEEKVGQLFLITFNGNDTSEISTIYELIVNYHIGGVVLDRDNDNFQNPDTLALDCWSLVNNLQHLEYDHSGLVIQDSFSFNNQSPAYIPLFIALSQEGNRSSYSELLYGISPIPSQMSLGATWNIDLAEDVGEQVGKELSILGVNMFLGPSLDVLSNPSPNQSSLGVRSFGGDPYWVGKFGQAYIRGLHKGSTDKIAVIGKYFPGLGSSDRLPEEEVATVRKSIEQLKQIDLAPFFSTTGYAPSEDSTVDGLLNSHIRFQGLQGNIRSTTRPISLDPQALDLLMNLEPFEIWRNSGGLVISDNLGSVAIKQLYDPSGEMFDISRVAVDAFIAGNDVLFLGNYGDTNNPISYPEIVSTLNFFTIKYKEDQDFAARVDESVSRILTLKESLYRNLSVSTVFRSEYYLQEIGKGESAEVVARQSATLINPSFLELEASLPNPPTSADRLVILTDTEYEKVCNECPETATFGITSLEDTIIKLYGPVTGRRMVRANLDSYSFKDLVTLLDFPSEAEQMITDLYNANWIIIAALDINEDRPYSQAITRLLSERQDLLQDKKIVVFAFGAPYYLDATNISKVTAFFGLYSKLPAAQEVAAKILFKEFPSITGSLPVSVPGINYDLITATSPDPSQGFLIRIGETPSDATSVPEGETPVSPVYKIEEILDIRTDIILDHNGNPVPDGTPVTFIVTSQGESTALPQTTTQDGTASITYLIESGIDFIIQAESSLAKSNELEITVLGNGSDFITGTDVATNTIEESPPAPISTETNGEDPFNGSPQPFTPWRLWGISMVIVFTASLFAYQVGASVGLVRWGLRWGFSSLLSGLLVYNYLTLNLPGTSLLFRNPPSGFSFGLVVFIGSLLGWLLAYLYQRLSSK